MLWLGVVGALATGCGKPPLGIEDIEQLLAQGRFAESIEPLRVLIKDDPDDPQVLYDYARALTSTGRPGQAIWALRLAMTDSEYLLPAGKLFIQTLIRGEAFDDAIGICNEMLGDLGENAEILALRSHAKQSSRQDYEGAIEDADRVLELEPDNVDVLIPRTVSLLKLNRVEEAGQALRELDDLYKDDATGVKGSGQFCTAGAMFAWEKGEPDLALKRFDRCLENFPADSILLPRALSFFDQRRDYDRTLEILRNALSVKPDDSSIRQNLALRLDSLGHREEATEVFREATQLGSPASQIQAWTTLAAFYAGTDDLDASIAAYEEALSRSTVHSPDLDFRYADTLIRSGRFDEALEWSKKMTVPAQKSLIRGRIFLATNRPSEALDEFTAGNRLWPNNAIARYYTAVAAEQTGDIDRAVEEYRYSIRIEPGATDAPIRLAQYELALADPGRAIGILMSSISEGSGAKRIEMELLLARVLSLTGRWRTANPAYLQTVMTPQRHGATMVAVAEGIRDRAGLESAIQFLEELPGLDLTQPRNAPILMRLVEWLVAVDRSQDALRLARAAKVAHPKMAAFQASYARALAETGGDSAEVEAAYAKAFEVDDRNAFATRGYAVFLEQKDPDDGRVVEFFEKAVELDPGDVESVKELAVLHRSHTDDRSAIEVMDNLVKRRPWDADALLFLASLLFDEGAPNQRERVEILVERARKLRHGPKDVDTRLDQLTNQLRAVSEKDPG